MALMLDLKGKRDGLCLNMNYYLYFCFYCGKIGHGERNCERKITDAKNDVFNEGQFGEWLRVANVRMSNKGRVAGKKDLDAFNLTWQGEVRDEGKGRVEGIGLERINSSGIKGERELEIETMEEKRNNGEVGSA